MKTLDWDDIKNRVLYHIWKEHKGLAINRNKFYVANLKQSQISKALTLLRKENRIIYGKRYWCLPKEVFQSFREEEQR